MSEVGVPLARLVGFGLWYVVGVLVHGLLCYLAFRQALGRVPKGAAFEAKCGDMGVRYLGPLKVQLEAPASGTKNHATRPTPARRSRTKKRADTPSLFEK